jgi:uncharacterized protein (TIGR02145 family)
MKRKSLFYLLGLFAMFLLLTNSCKKDDSSNNDNNPTATVPVLTTTTVSNITFTTATAGGNVTNDNGKTVTVRGVCWSTGNTPTVSDSKTTDGTGTGAFISSITGLTAGTTYYVRAYATSSAGTGYGSAISFKALGSGTLTDIEGNIYPIVNIGTQVWMGENLKATKFKDNTSIPLVTDGTEWHDLNTPGYCWYENDASTYKKTYGALYNWFTINTGKLCPTGWHVPTNTEWTTLTTYLGGENVAGGKLKEAGTMHWDLPNTGATNESSFTALPGGHRDDWGTFYNIRENSLFGSSTEYNTDIAYDRSLDRNNSEIVTGMDFKEMGFSIRCVKD